MSDGLNEIRTALKNNSVIIGKDEVLKAMKNGTLLKVFLASNASKAMIDEVKYASELSGVDMGILSIPNDELKVICRKQFLISTIGIKK
jgi:ribosomal protein L30E